jgi:hypothetical protein
MKCNKKPYYKVGMTATSAEKRRRSIQRSIRQEFGNEYLVNVEYVKKIENNLMCSLIEWQIQHYLMLKGYQKFWNGLTVKSNGSSEWFYLPKGLKQLKKYIALGFKYWESNPAPMPEFWEIKRNGKIFKKPKPKKLNIKTATRRELRDADIRGEIGNNSHKTFKTSETRH